MTKNSLENFSLGNGLEVTGIRIYPNKYTHNQDGTKNKSLAKVVVTINHSLQLCNITVFEDDNSSLYIENPYKIIKSTATPNGRKYDHFRFVEPKRADAFENYILDEYENLDLTASAPESAHD